MAKKEQNIYFFLVYLESSPDEASSLNIEIAQVQDLFSQKWHQFRNHTNFAIKVPR
jgi:hypothetical protein